MFPSSTCPRGKACRDRDGSLCKESSDEILLLDEPIGSARRLAAARHGRRPKCALWLTVGAAVATGQLQLRRPGAAGRCAAAKQLQLHRHRAASLCAAPACCRPKLANRLRAAEPPAADTGYSGQLEQFGRAPIQQSGRATIQPSSSPIQPTTSPAKQPAVRSAKQLARFASAASTTTKSCRGPGQLVCRNRRCNAPGSATSGAPGAAASGARIHRPAQQTTC